MALAVAHAIRAKRHLAVQAGTGTAAQIPGIQGAGKTGTAATGINHVYTAWFVCFAPADNPRVAVAVVGTIAAAVFYLFEVIIVVGIQAFIFAALSAIYIGSAIEPEH